MTPRYLVHRLLHFFLAVTGIVVVTFIVVQMVPGDPIVALAGEASDPAYLAALRREYGLDRSLPLQFVTYMGKVARGDLGDSFAYGAPVLDVIAARSGPTLLLSGSALLISTTLGILLGAIAAKSGYRRFDRTVNSATLFLYAVPAFWLAQVAILVFALRLKIFPLLGYTDARTSFTGLARWADIAYHLMLPALVLAASEIALLARTTRIGLLQEFGKDYVRTAQAKGMSDDVVLSHHALRNALLPVVTVIGTRVGFLISGAVVIETVFAWPGLGTVIITAARQADRPLMLGIVILIAAGVVTANLITDLIYARIDPRIRYD